MQNQDLEFHSQTEKKRETQGTRSVGVSTETQKGMHAYAGTGIHRVVELVPLDVVRTHKHHGPTHYVCNVNI